MFNRLGTLPTRNFQQATFEEADALSGESLTENEFQPPARLRVLLRFAASGCSSRVPARSSGSSTRPCSRSGRCAASAIPRSFSPRLRLCDRYGLDAISTGGTLAWAIESVEKGLLPEAEALGLRFGHGDAVLAAIRAIAEREGVGALLAEGSKRAAIETGRDSSLTGRCR